MSKHDDDDIEDKDDDDETDDADDSDADLGDSDDDESDDGDSDDSQDDDHEPEDDDDDGEATVASAAPHEVEAHRNMIGAAFQHLSDDGVDIDTVAEQAGISSSDVDELTHGDLASITKYLGEHHPDALQEVSDDYPEAQGLLQRLSTGGGFLGRLFGR